MKRVKKSDAIHQLAKMITESKAHSSKTHPNHRLAVSLAYVMWNLNFSYKSGFYNLDDMDIRDLVRQFN